METHIHTRGGYTSSVESSINTRRYTSYVGVQHGNIQSHWIYKLPGSPAWKHTFTQEDIQAICGREYKHKMIGQNIAQYGMR